VALGAVDSDGKVLAGADAGSDAPPPGVANGDAVAHPLTASSKAAPTTVLAK
jgi:hypothetical protein